MVKNGNRKEYEYTPLYYDGAIQVRWYDWRDGKYHGGIGFHEFLITGRGELFYLDDVVSYAISRGVYWDDAVIEMEWLNLDESIYPHI